MLQAKLSSGVFVIGFDDDDIKQLLAGQPIKADLGDDNAVIIYSETLQDFQAKMERLSR